MRDAKKTDLAVSKLAGAAITNLVKVRKLERELELVRYQRDRLDRQLKNTQECFQAWVSAWVDEHNLNTLLRMQQKSLGE